LNEHLLARTAFSLQRTFVSTPAGEQVEVLPRQIIFWISVAPPSAIDLPSSALRFPVVFDTGFNGSLVIREEHLNDWGGYGPTALLTTGAALLHGEPARLKRANVWLHFDRDSDAPPCCLELAGGIVVTTPASAKPRLPLLGMRAFEASGLRAMIDYRARVVTVARPQNSSQDSAFSG
jgi:hypothetical protein